MVQITLWLRRKGPEASFLHHEDQTGRHLRLFYGWLIRTMLCIRAEYEI